MANVVGQRSTYQTSSGVENRQVRNVLDEILALEPSEAPLVTLLNKIGAAKPVDQVKLEWFEDDYTARWAQMGTTTAAAATASTTLVVLDSTLFNVGDVWVACNGDLTTHQEGVVVKSIDSATQITVQRNIYGGTIGAINASSALRYAGVALEEGATIPDARTTSPVAKVSYIQEFSHTVELSDTAMNSRTYGSQGSGEMRRLVAKRMKEHKIAINSALLFGKANELYNGGPNSKTIRTTQGIIPTISTNITNAATGGGMLTRKLWDAYMAQTFRYGPKDKLFLSSATVTRAINAWASNYLQVTTPSATFGVDVRTIVTPFGKLRLVNDWSLEDGISGKSGFNGIGVAIDTDQIDYCYLSGPEGSFNMAFVKDAGNKNVHARKDEFHSKIGFRIRNEKYHSLLIGVTDYQA